MYELTVLISVEFRDHNVHEHVDGIVEDTNTRAASTQDRQTASGHSLTATRE